MIIVMILLVLLTPTVFCWMGAGGNKNNVNLNTLAEQLYDTELRYRVAFGDSDSPFTMNGLHVALASDNRRRNQPFTTGLHTAALLQKPWYITNQGEQSVDLQEGGWEVSWRPTSCHGFLSCSFVAPEALQRNDQATSQLEAGRFFVNHRVWTRATLASERKRRRDIQAQAAGYLEERNQKIREMNGDTDKKGSNKVLSYAQATRASNKYFTSGYKEALYIPLHDDQVLELAPDCLVSTRGEIYSKEGRRTPERVGLSRVDFLTTSA